VIRLVIADDHPVVREGLVRVLDDAKDIRVAGVAASGYELLDLLKGVQTNVVLLDISMPGPPFLELLGEIRKRWPRLHILVVSAHPENQYAVRALKAGARGYLTKDRSPEELTGAIRKVHRGGRYISSTLAEELASRLDPQYRESLHETLSQRELRTVALLAAGESIKEIAASLKVSPKTVSTYRRRALDKLSLETNADLIRYANDHDPTPD
jgi:two-component system, NarL family, invasion response regulator UvrY